MQKQTISKVLYRISAVSYAKVLIYWWRQQEKTVHLYPVSFSGFSCSWRTLEGVAEDQLGPDDQPMWNIHLFFMLCKNEQAWRMNLFQQNSKLLRFMWFKFFCEAILVLHAPKASYFLLIIELTNHGQAPSMGSLSAHRLLLLTHRNARWCSWPWWWTTPLLFWNSRHFFL